MLGWLRVAWRLQRWELGLSIGALCVLTVGALVTPMTTLVGSDAWMTLLAFTLIVPIVSGLALGVGIVGREIGMRTGHLAWTLEPRRDRWLLGRAWPVVLMVGLPCLVLSVATARLIEHSGPSQAYQLAMTGPNVAFRFVLALAVGIGLGAALRRELPGLLVGLPLMVGLVAVIGVATDPWLRANAVMVPQGEIDGRGFVRALTFEMAERDTAGRWVVREPQCDSPASCDAAYATMTMVMTAVPPAMHGPYAAVEALVALAGVAGFGGLARWAISRRGPD
ncbi:MAG TPA: hypothetical protein VFM19_00880 [Candidatus Limnocylindria bacterium]|nr:hypothetical protein [Candidatus Limnocylindria bacterium]